MGYIIESSGLETMCAFILLFWLMYLYYVKDYGYWKKVQVADVPPIFPLGSLPTLVLGKLTWSDALTNVYKHFPRDRYVGFTYVREPCLLLRDPDLIKRVLDTDFDCFTDRFAVTVHPKDYMANNMYNMRGSEWKNMKPKLTPAYATADNEMMFYLLKSSSKKLLQVINELPGEIKVIDTKDLLSTFVIDTIAKCAFGNDINWEPLEHTNVKLYGIVKRKFFNCRNLLKIFALKSFPVFTKYHMFDLFGADVTTFFSTEVVNALEYRDKHNIDRGDFFGMMMKLWYNLSILEKGEPADSRFPSTTNKGLTVEEIAAEMHLFILKGHESTADTCLFCLYELACHKQLQKRLFKEVKMVLAGHGNLNYQAMLQMTFMDQVIKEVMRLYPVSPMLMRSCTQTYKVPNSRLIIKKGMGVYIPVSALHRDPKYFPDPDTFDPDRFSPDNHKNIKPFVFLPFGAGPRTCMGSRFGMMVVKSALASIVSRYVVDLTPETEVPLVLSKTKFSSSPEKPVKLRLTPRLPT